jgi:hypothetical protein
MTTLRCTWCFATYTASDGNICPECGQPNSLLEQNLIAAMTAELIAQTEAAYGCPLPPGLEHAIWRATTYQVCGRTMEEIYHAVSRAQR